MGDVELYQQVLGLKEPWKASEVKLDLQEQQVEVRVEHPEGCSWKCPQCERQLGCYDHAPAFRGRSIFRIAVQSERPSGPPR